MSANRLDDLSPTPGMPEAGPYPAGTPSANEPSRLDENLLKQAADWAITLQYEQPSAQVRHAFEQWRVASPRHEAAWQRAQSVFQTFEQLPTEIGKGAVRSLTHGYDRRRSLRALAMMLTAVPVGLLSWRHVPWRQWTADASTTIGERRAMVLPDGSQLVLNSDSAVNIAFTDTVRRIRLVAGEILVTTHVDPAPAARPFLVDTSVGVVRALGTRFSVRRLEADVFHVAVYEHAVEVRPLQGETQVLEAGRQANFSAHGVDAVTQVEPSAALWEQGMLLAKDMRLADVLDELSRYRPGVLRCDPAVADLRVSGAISLADTDAGLAALARSLPVRIVPRTRYWVTVVPRV